MVPAGLFQLVHFLIEKRHISLVIVAGDKMNFLDCGGFHSSFAEADEVDDLVLRADVWVFDNYLLCILKIWSNDGIISMTCVPVID